MKNSQELKSKLDDIRKSVAEVVVGQQELVDKLITALICNGHVLIEGVPGIAKTLVANTLSQALGARCSRVQFTPDLLPGDLTGTRIYRAESGQFETCKGPIFANLVLADEINRAPAKVQSALLEAMQERQVTLGRQSHRLPEPFMVLATQNPIEQEGTYALPEAQIDRFMFKLVVSYPAMEEEHLILKRMARSTPVVEAVPVATLDDVLAFRGMLDTIYMDEKIERYILRVVAATRDPSAYQMADLKQYIRFGASPRASIYLALAARGHALIRSADFVAPDDVKAVLHDVVRHRIAITYRAEADGVNSDILLNRIASTVAVDDS
jgi:MoxR-like ATPase